MNCYYCDKIVAADESYTPAAATRDLGSEAPRCDRHWRYVCGKCSQPAHFMATAFCQSAQTFFCRSCATDWEEIGGSFWAWSGYFRYGSPWTGEWEPALDRLEFEGKHPALIESGAATAAAAVSSETYLFRYGVDQDIVGTGDRQFTEAEINARWTRSAEQWDADYNDDGDITRRYFSDEPMLELLGDVDGKSVLDVGSGNGYLCRKLARAGATITGVELADGFVKIARQRESAERLGITYYQASASSMSFLPDASFDAAVSNYVLMDIQEYEQALAEVFRILKPGGPFVVVISHPAFACGHGWWKPAPDSPRIEDRGAWLSDLYFHPRPVLVAWGDRDPVPNFHRPLRDYWRAFKSTGFLIDDFEEPSVTERGRRELLRSHVEDALRTPDSCMFRLVKPAESSS